MVTNQAAANATATLTSNNGCFAYTFSGKVRPDFRTNGQTTVSLVCTQACVLQGTCDPQTVPGNLVFPQCTNTNLDVSSFCGGPVVTNSCGDFSFTVPAGSGTSPTQLDPGYVCNFVVHAAAVGTPSSCNGKTQPPPQDPNGSAPCSGTFCPGN